ncbi:unnamed protein product, partial [Mesorhabditis belari]|uniref:Multivesicular body subunit 12A n=1 Tax=Mesorhabditis belari TaxID=2138241 RepID=A0AAF3ENM8_9BILA
MSDRELTKSGEMEQSPTPITGLCIVADKNKPPRGFSAISKANDDSSDADLWRESSFSIFSRPVRYLCFSRDTPNTGIKAPISVVTDITIVKESEPIPHGFVAIDYTADSGERALRKKFLCVKSEPRDAVVDAIGEIVLLNKAKKTPRDYTSAGEIDGIMVCFRVIVIPPNFGVHHSNSERNISITGQQPTGLYPGLGIGGGGPSQSTPDLSNVDHLRSAVNAFTIKPMNTGPKPLDGVEFKLNPIYEQISGNKQKDVLPAFPQIDLSRLDSDEMDYRYQLEHSTLQYCS